jgi:hypothetical protein
LREDGSDQSLTITSAGDPPNAIASVTGLNPGHWQATGIGATEAADPLSGIKIELKDQNGPISVPASDDAKSLDPQFNAYQGEIVELELDGLASGEYWCTVSGQPPADTSCGLRLAAINLLLISPGWKNQLELSNLTSTRPTRCESIRARIRRFTR